MDRAMELGEQYENVTINEYTLYSAGVDVGFGSSRTAIVITEHLKEGSKIRVFINLMKVAFNESLNWEKSTVNPEVMKVLPGNFSTEHKQILAHLHMLVNKEYLAVPSEHDKLIISLRTDMG
jgi:hypothetical protein